MYSMLIVVKIFPKFVVSFCLLIGHQKACELKFTELKLRQIYTPLLLVIQIYVKFCKKYLFLILYFYHDIYKVG
jgi:hypothetical protein